MFEWVLFTVSVVVLTAWVPGSYFIWYYTDWCLLCYVNGLFGVEKVDHDRL